MSGDDLDQAVDGFRRAEAALAAITDDAERIAATSAELIDARAALVVAGEDLKVVAGALVGLATAHKELVAQLGSAATALGQGQGRRLELESTAAEGQVVSEADAETAAALQRAEEELAQAARVGEVLVAVEALGDRLLAALAEVSERDRSAQPALPVAAARDRDGGIVLDRIDDVERRLWDGQRRVVELVLVQGLAFLVLAAMIGYLAIR